MTKNRRKLLSDEPAARTVLVGPISLADGQRRSTENILRTFHYADDPFYGEFGVDVAMLDEMIQNFAANVYGQRLSVNIAHRDESGAAAHFVRVYREGDRLMAELEWTDMGVRAIRDQGFRYFSAEYTEKYRDPETDAKHGTVLQGAALTIRPRIKHLYPVEPERLEFCDELPGGRFLAATPTARILLSEEITTMWTKLLLQLAEVLGSLKLAGSVVAKLKAEAEKALQGVTDESAATAVIAAFETAGRQLSEQIGSDPATINLTVNPAAPSGLTAADVTRLMAEQRLAEETAQLALTATLERSRTLFTTTLQAAEVFATLSEDQQAQRLSAVDLITPQMTEEQVRSLAAHEIATANEISVQAQLAQRGYPLPNGAVHVQHVTSGDSLRLHEAIAEQLRRSAPAINRTLALSATVSPFAERVLAEFDRLHAPAIHREVLLLAGGETNIGDTSLPVGFQRQVIREALHDLRVLELVQTLTDPVAQGTTQIPYELRDTSGVQNDGIVYEGGAIHQASLSQAMDLAYIVPMKLSFLITNEVSHFTRSSAINWDAYARNLEMNARVMRELIVKRICNELQRSADTVGATAVVGEAFDAQVTGANSIIKTVNYPIVRPHQQKDLQGTNVGAAENAIAMVLNGVAISAYDGTGLQGAGTYYRVTSYNLGYIQLVSELGVPVTPADTGVNTLAYSYATNVQKFDLDVPGATTLEKHLNGLLQAIGARKAALNADRFVMPDFMLMSPVLNDIATNAETFTAAAARDGADTTAMGDLERIKGISAWGTNAPSIDLGDERILMGQRGTLTYTVAKPFITGAPFEVVDNASGKPVGKRQAYGEEYSSIKVPQPIRNRLTSVLAYSFTGR